MKKTGAPVIGVTVDTNQGQEDAFPQFSGQTVFWLKKFYTEAVEKSGAQPVLIPVVSSPARVSAYLDMIDGLVISGGHFDIDPAMYGQKPHPKTGPIKPDRTRMEMALFKAAVKRKMPVLGICGGFQAINVALGGTLYQHIPDQLPGALEHENPRPSTQPSHRVAVTKGSLLARVTGVEKLNINSTHHQGIDRLGRGLSACATAPDGLIEAIEHAGAGDSFILGVQWHPEALFATEEASRKIFRRLVAECRKYRKNRTGG